MANKKLAIPSITESQLARWRKLDRDALLAVGDDIDLFTSQAQWLFGAWLYTYSEHLKYGDIKSLAERYGRSSQTLRNWKSVYKKTRNIPQAVQSLPYSKVSELARIPAKHQADWIEPAAAMSRQNLRIAVTEAKRLKYWSAPTDCEMPTVITPEPEPEASDLGKYDIRNIASKWQVPFFGTVYYKPDSGDS